MTEEIKNIELKEEELEKVTGGEFNPTLGWKLVCNSCGGEMWEAERGPGNTCRFCHGCSLRTK